MIPKGCTGKNHFRFPDSKDDVETIYITYVQNGNVVIEKNIDDCSFSEGKVSVNLSQKETLMLTDKTAIKAQIRTRLKNGVVTKSNIVEARTDYLLKDGEI